VRNGIQEELDDDRVAAWRRDQLVQSGFSSELAWQLARDGRYDLHALIDLVERGCLPEVAVRIVSPLDGERAA
jgi:hypothetical protein